MRKIINFTIITLVILSSISIDAQANKQVETEVTDSIHSKVLDDYRHFWVKLPENYNPKSGAKYPVIYLLDGFSLQSNLEVVYNNYWGLSLIHI